MINSILIFNIISVMLNNFELECLIYQDKYIIQWNFSSIKINNPYNLIRCYD